jgi:hypothetical protein
VARPERSRGPEELLRQFHVNAIVQDASHTNLPEESIDLFVSQAVLEYIPREKLSEILSEFRRIAHRNAIMSHFIDISDEYSYFDRSITPLNHLQYSDALWRLLTTTYARQNRLLIPDYRELLASTGFEVVHEENTMIPADLLEEIRLASQFRCYSPDELRVRDSWLVSRPKGPTGLPKQPPSA